MKSEDGPSAVECRDCDGTGVHDEPDERVEPCVTCDGSGRVTLAPDEDWDT